jgi:hypothetical protein
VQSDNGWNLERPCEDGRVVRAAPGVHREPADASPVDLRGHGRRELVRHEHKRPFYVAQQRVRGYRALPQVHAKASRNVFHVALPLPQVRVLDRVEHLLDFLERAMHRPLGVDALLADEGQRAAEQQGIIQNQELCLEQWRELRPEAVGDAGRDPFELDPRAIARLLQALDLPFHLLGGNGEPHGLAPVREQHGATRSSALRDRHTLQALHGSSPSPV